MKYKEFIQVIRDLSKSQGFYGRLLRSVETLSPTEARAFRRWVKKQNFKTPLDVVMAFEA